tara:strand:- start:1727 stop:2596 length:870 start_codon:yes stop_codon:yes gene_type:complete
MLWTGALVVSKILTIDHSPFLIVPLQMSIGTIIIYLLIILSHKKVDLNGFYSGIIFGLVAPGMAFSLFMIASTKTDAISMIIFWSLIPLLTPVFGKIFLSEIISPILYLGLSIALTGSFFLIQMRTSYGSSNIDGNIIALGGVFCSIIGHILGRGFNLKHSKPLDMALGQVFGATITSSLILFIYLMFDQHELEIIHFENILEILVQPSFVYLTIFATALNFTLYNFALSKIPVAWVSFYSVFIPPLGAILSYYILNEALFFNDVIAISVVLIGGLIPSMNKIIFLKIK